MPTLLATPADDATRRDLLRGAGLFTAHGFLAARGGDGGAPVDDVRAVLDAMV